MAKNRYIDTKYWSDSYISELDPSEKLLFIYLLTNQYTNICGIYEIPLKQIALDTGIDKNMIEKIIKRFENDIKIKYLNGWIAIKNWLKHQSDKGNVIKGIEAGFLLAPIELVNWIKDKELSKPLEDPSSPLNYPNPNPNPNPNIKEQIEALYVLYPTTCKNRKQSTGKCLKDKDKISKLIKSYGYEQLTNIFNHYLKDKDTIYLKNFSTFLNNLPDPEAIAEEVKNENKWPTNRPQEEVNQIMEWFNGPEYTRDKLKIMYYNNKFLKESEYDYLVNTLKSRGLE